MLTIVMCDCQGFKLRRYRGDLLASYLLECFLALDDGSHVGRKHGYGGG